MLCQGHRMFYMTLASFHLQLLPPFGELCLFPLPVVLGGLLQCPPLDHRNSCGQSKTSPMVTIIGLALSIWPNRNQLGSLLGTVCLHAQKENLLPLEIFSRSDNAWSHLRPCSSSPCPALGGGSTKMGETEAQIPRKAETIDGNGEGGRANDIIWVLEVSKTWPLNFLVIWINKFPSLLQVVLFVSFVYYLQNTHTGIFFSFFLK